MIPLELEPEIFAADFTGRPGQRTFFIQARSGTGSFTYLLEKEQVAVLADKLREVLLLVDPNDPVLAAGPQRDPALALEPPLEPEFRIGTIGLSYDEATGHVIVALRPVEEGVEDTDDPTELEQEEFPVRFRLRPDQVRAFVLHGLQIVVEGRPACQLCGLPMDPEGHVCPASNGHRVQM